MRRSSLFFLIALTLFSFNIVPTFASADTSITGKTDCAAGSSTVDPTGQQSFGASDNDAKNIQAYIHNAESCASACFDEKIDVTVDTTSNAPKVNVAVSATNECGSTPISQPAKAQPPRGCSAKQTQPQITLQVPEISAFGITYLKQQTIGPKSRCYEAVANAVGGLTKGGISGMASNPGAIQTNFDALQSLGTQAPLASPAGTIAGNDQLIAALTSSGIGAGDAQKLAADPVSAQALINAYATGNKDTIQDTVQDAAAKAGINLNDGVYDNIASLSATKVQAAQTNLAPLADQSGTTISSDTFDSSQGGAAPGAAASQFSTLCTQMGGCGNACNTAAPSLVCRANNPGALTYAPWEAKYGGYACGLNNNAACFPTMEQGIEAQARLLTTTPTYFGNGNKTILDVMCQSYATNAAGNNCGAYAAAIQNYTGIPMNQTIDPKNAQQVGSIMMAMSRVESGSGVIFTPDQLQTGLSAAYGGTILTGTPGYVPGTVYNAGAGSPFGSLTGGGTSPVGQVMSSSPFANVSPIYSTPGLGSSPSYPIQYVQPPVQYPPTASPITQPSVQGTSTVQAGQSGTPVAQIIAEPQTVHVGGSITLAWSSVGMSTASPCQILENGSVVTNASNQGSQIVTASTTGKISFSLNCTAQATGAAITGSATVLVQ